MDRQDSILFLTWLSQRLRYKHNYRADSAVIVNLNDLKDFIRADRTLDISDKDLDIIISKYYIDFLLDKTEDFRIGYSQDEREEFRNNIKSIIFDVINKNIPTHYIS